jgi:hypothetical protein
VEATEVVEVGRQPLREGGRHRPAIWDDSDRGADHDTLANNALHDGGIGDHAFGGEECHVLKGVEASLESICHGLDTVYVACGRKTAPVGLVDDNAQVGQLVLRLVRLDPR